MRETKDMATVHEVSCHCGGIQLEVNAELDEVSECNCSICLRSGFLHWYVAPDQVRLSTQKRLMSTYLWRTATGGQHFCPTCGIAVIRTSTEHPPPVSINARCVKDVDLARLRIRPFDGKHLIP
jgi:hypothetical protein